MFVHTEQVSSSVGTLFRDFDLLDGQGHYSFGSASTPLRILVLTFCFMRLSARFCVI